MKLTASSRLCLLKLKGDSADLDSQRHSMPASLDLWCVFVKQRPHQACDYCSVPSTAVSTFQWSIRDVWVYKNILAPRPASSSSAASAPLSRYR